MLVDSDTYWRYRIEFWRTRYDINLIISVDIADMADISDIDDIDTENHWSKPIPIPSF